MELRICNNNNQPLMLSMQDKSADSIDPEFLTFRHNNTPALPSSGRSIYSQRFDYKSLSKYALFDTCNSQREDINLRTHKKTPHSIKQKQLRTVKSQEKYRELIPPELFNAEEIRDDLYLPDIDEITTRTVTSKRQLHTRQQNKNSKQINMDTNSGSMNKKLIEATEQKNCELKLKLSKLVKSMKKEQRKQCMLQQEIAELQTQIQGFDREIEEQQISLNQLKEISQENITQCSRIIDIINKVSSRSQDMAARLEDIEESVDSQQTDLGTCRQDEAKDRLLCSKLKQGLTDLTRMKNAAENKAAILEQQIQYMQAQLEQMRSHEVELMRILGFRSEPTSGHNSPSYSQNASHNSSSGSQRESIYYY